MRTLRDQGVPDGIINGLSLVDALALAEELVKPLKQQRRPATAPPPLKGTDDEPLLVAARRKNK